MKAARALTILDAINDKRLFAPWFRDRTTWGPWFSFIAALFGLGSQMTPEQIQLYRQCTGRNDVPISVATSAFLICGRRAGKSFVLALIAVFLACFHDYRRYLQPSERATILIIAVDRKQARVILRYVRGLLTGVPMLARMIERETSESFDLSNSITIEVASASFRSVRGYSIAACCLDELAFVPTGDVADPDYEIINAIRPGMATIPGAMLLCASSPYAKKGALWDAYRKHFGKDGDPVLVWKAPTRVMNATVPQSIIDEAMERDPASAAAEYGAEFRSDIESFVSREAVEACVAFGLFERAPISTVEYKAFVDPSGGSADSMTLAIGHREGDLAVVDALREAQPPFNPEGVVDEFADLLRQYRVRCVTGDRYAGEWPREQFRKRDIDYALSDRPCSDLYRDMLPALNARQVSLLEHDRLVNQIVSLERRTGRSGKDAIGHPVGSHDDLATSVAGLVALLNVRSTYNSLDFSWVDGDTPDANEQFRQRIYERLYGEPYRRIR